MSTVTVSKENYLKAILQIEREKGEVHASEIAEAMKITRPSVSNAVHQLEQEGYIRIDGDHCISLTPAGLKLASSVMDRYETFYQLFLALGVPKDIASFDAGRIEHAISDASFTYLKRMLSFQPFISAADRSEKNPSMDHFR